MHGAAPKSVNAKSFLRFHRKPIMLHNTSAKTKEKETTTHNQHFTKQNTKKRTYIEKKYTENYFGFLSFMLNFVQPFQ